MKLEGGMNLDYAEVDQPAGTYRFAKNITDSSVLGSKENEDGLLNLSVTTPYTFIGSIPVDGSNVVVFSTNNTSSEIGLVNLSSNTYTALYNNSGLNFNTASPIHGEYRKDVNGDRLIAFTDSDRNTLRVANIDNFAGVDSIEDLNAFQDVINPSLLLPSILQSGGSLPSGAFIPISKYQNSDGSETNWFVHDHTFYINDDSTARAFNDNDGASPGTVTNKGLVFTLNGCDTRYDSVIVGYVKIINNITTAYSLGARDNSSTVGVTITGAEATTDVTLDELLTPTANYNTVGTITQLAGQLYGANVTVEALPELQPYALDIRINYNHSSMNVISNTSSHKQDIPPAFMPGEVYAFYLGVELNKGGWAFYHIAGRSAVGTEGSSVTSEGMTYSKYQVDDTSNNVLATTNMGYWENTGETYPNVTAYNGASVGGRDLRNTAVKHHRFPTLDSLITNHYSGDSTIGVTHLVKLGINVSNVNIPVAIQAKIKRWKIFFAKKEDSNRLVLGSDLWHPSCSTSDDSTIRWSSGGNWALQADTHSGSYSDFNAPSLDTIRGHSLDLMYSNTTVTPTYARFYYRLKRGNLNTQYSGFRSSGARLTVSGASRGLCASAVIDYTVPTWTTRDGSGFIKRLDNFALLPQNALSGKFKSQHGESVFVADVNSPGSSFNTLTAIKLLTKSTGLTADPLQFRNADGSDGGTVLSEATMYMQYFRILTSVHSSFTQQDLIPVEGYSSLPSSTSGTFAGGDSFMCYMSYLTITPPNANPDILDSVTASQAGVRMWKAYIGYSKYNFNYRYQTQGDLGTYYHGKTDVRTLFTPTVVDYDDHEYTSLIKSEQSLNEVLYDSTMNTSNNYITGTIYDPSIIEATEFPNTIIWSPVQNEESREFSWRSFPSGNRFVLNKDKGDITKIQGYGNRQLLINTQDSFYRTRTDTAMDTDSGEVFLRTAGVFSLPPEELVPSRAGVAGCQHKFGAILTKVGYVFQDVKRGAIYLYNGQQLEEISSKGMSIFFYDSMSTLGADNPFIGSGYTTGYDTNSDRLIITKKTTNNTSWTISYNINKKQWTCFHDYIPNYLINTLDGKLYSIKSNTFYLHGEGVKGNFYGVVYPSYIDVVFNPQPEVKKLAQGVSWNTEVYPNSYIDGQPSNFLDYDTTCTHLTLRTADHCTGRIALAATASLYDIYTANIRNKDRIWYYNEIRDFTKAVGFLKGFYDNYTVDTAKLNTDLDWFEQRQFIDKYVICRFEYDNTVNKRWILLDTNIQFGYVPV